MERTPFKTDLENLEKHEEIIFLSLTNSSKKYSKNIINLGVNIDSQMRKINSYLKENEYELVSIEDIGPNAKMINVKF